MTFAAIQTFAPGFAGPRSSTAQGVSAKGPSGDRMVVVRENTAFPALAKVFAATPITVWGDWLTVHYLHNLAAYLPKRFEDADFDFFGQVLGGPAAAIAARDARRASARSALGHPLGKIYVSKYFPPESKAKVEALIANLLKAYDADIRQIPWMTDATRQKALDKLHAFVPHVGYPDTWRDYSGSTIARDDLVGDIERSNEFETRYRLARIDNPVDRNEWNMTPPTINAYYTPVFNSIFFPAAILQPPFFDPNADDAVNYGGDRRGDRPRDQPRLRRSGVEVRRHGHAAELVDGCGPRRVRRSASTALGAQYDAYEPLPGMHVNGRLTMGENIGDLVRADDRAQGVSHLARTASRRRARRLHRRSALLPGVRARSGAPSIATARCASRFSPNPHSPPQFRVIGSTHNIDDWYAAFDVQARATSTTCRRISASGCGDRATLVVGAGVVRAPWLT